MISEAAAGTATLSARVLDGQAKMSARRLVWPSDSPVWRKWAGLLGEYEDRVRAGPEPPAESCLDCGLPSERGLTPCDTCIREARRPAQRV